MNSKVKILTRTAILLALTIVFQSIGRFVPAGINSQFIVGPLVNAALIVSTAATGIWGGAFIALATPYGAMLTGAAVPLPFSPFIALGNLVIVVCFYALMKRNKIIAILVGAVAKFAFLAAAVNIFVEVANAPAKQAKNLLTAFTWPQLFTALIGGVIAFGVMKALGKNIDART